MHIDFNEMQEMKVPGMNGGTGEMTVKMYTDAYGKMIPCHIHAGGSIGLHKYETSIDMNYIISGCGQAICDGKEEILKAGVCHICPKGSEHCMINTGDEDLILLTVVVEQ